MLASISPFGERARHNRWWVTVVGLAAASAAGGALVSSLAASAGLIVLGRHGARSYWWLAALACLSAAAVDAAGWVLPPHRQVDEGWLTSYRRWVYALGFGFQLGAGVLTVITTAAVPLVLLLAFLGGDPALGAVIGAAFGLARTTPVAALAGVHTPSALRRRHQGLAGAAPVARWATVGLLLLAAAAV